MGMPMTSSSNHFQLSNQVQVKKKKKIYALVFHFYKYLPFDVEII